ncbi:MAG: CDP-alcohol phosphatidyltransferase family protein [Candidatus Zixiibacteriota bacterium]|nr:MAG: CDP-alcohol phosphatidyltransferase family protein [candidate division Zixibacteria bacterium]
MPNLVSLFRVVLIPFLGYFLAQGDSRSTLICAGLYVLAGISDGLDGYLARKMGQVSQFGIALDPIADKVLAGALVILLIFYRDFPVWLAAAILGRDLLILIAGLLLLKGKKVVVPSNITGKYAFGVMAFLLGSYIIRFEFGIVLTTWVAVILLILSTIVYARVFVLVRKGRPAPVSADKPVYKFLRVGGSVLLLVLFFYKLTTSLL